MKLSLPAPEALRLDWKPATLENWNVLLSAVHQLEARAGKGDLFQQIIAQFMQMSRSGDFRQLPELLKKRVGARALTQLWLEDGDFRRRLLNRKLLESLVAMQQPTLGIMTLHNLITLYFREFDQLDQQEAGLRDDLEQVIKIQLDRRSVVRRQPDSRDVLAILHAEAPWLLSVDGPMRLVQYLRAENRELAEAFVDFELRGLDTGRYADICRAHYYLNTLKELPLGQYDDVFAELLKPSVCKAPYQGDKRIGHAALELLIDRAEGDPGENWQNFIMDMAGDPRIASTATSYREWWRPLGEARIERVRSWLAKEDLRLFLKALEQYGRESGKEDLQRMFPARQRFLEGLDKLKLVRRTRLMLGNKAAHIVKKILGSELKTSYVQLTNENGMSDKAVIYIDCGDFCIVEGSHSFKMWVYLAPPDEKVYSYDVKSLSHHDLTFVVPENYKKEYGASAPYAAIVHSPRSWQNKVFEFLANHGIALDLERLLGQKEYSQYIRFFGMPVVRANKTHLRFDRKSGEDASHQTVKNDVSVANRSVQSTETQPLSKLAISILSYLHYNGAADVRSMAYVLKTSNSEIINTINRELSQYCAQDKNFRWKIKSEKSDSLKDKGLFQ